MRSSGNDPLITPAEALVRLAGAGLSLEDELPRLSAVLGAIAAEAEQAEVLIDALSPERVLGPAALEQVRLNAEARFEFLEAWPSLTSSEVADLVGSKATNRAAAAHKLSGRGQIFSVRYKRRDLYPLFQFDPVEAKQLPSIRDVLRALEAAGLRRWEIAFWFVEPNGWLGDDARPVDLLESDPAAVVEAAQREAEIPE